MKNIPWDYEPPRPAKKPRKWPVITPELHDAIKRLYQTKSGNGGEVKSFAQKKGLPRWKITRYAQEQGWSAKQKKEPNWSDKELHILRMSAHHCPEVALRKLKAAGYNRSLVGIVLKRKRMRYLQDFVGDGQSATSLAMCLGEDIHFVTSAIKAGQLKAIRRQQNRTQRQGGNAFLIRSNQARAWILENIHKIDLRKVDKYWFVDLLANTH